MNAPITAACATAAWYSLLAPPPRPDNGLLLVLLLFALLLLLLFELDVVLAVMLSGVASFGGVGGKENRWWPAPPWLDRLPVVGAREEPRGLCGLSSFTAPPVAPVDVGKPHGVFDVSAPLPESHGCSTEL